MGVDKRGFTWTGYVEGYITAEVMHDWTQKSSAEGSDLITAVSKKAAVPVGAWYVIDLEPECTLFSTANVQNVSRGCTHGKHLDSPARGKYPADGEEYGASPRLWASTG